MKHLIDAIIKKWFCCHEWEYLFERRVEVVDDWVTIANTPIVNKLNYTLK